jgi:hypothetical protein
MKKIMIPHCRNPFVVILNGIRYEYESGKEIEVPDEIAEVIAFHVDSKPKALPYVGGFCNRPHVYFSDIANKLPDDAVDGSLAVVTEEIKGTKWVLNDEVAPLTEEGEHPILFWVESLIGDPNLSVSNWMSYTTVGPPVYGLKFNNIGYVYYYETNYGMTKGWIDEIYKNLVVISAGETAQAWLEANGTNTGEIVLLDETTTLYSRENGEWVAQGEVDFTDLASS